MTRWRCRPSSFLLSSLALLLSLHYSQAVKCLDCVGKDCMGNFCEGDYCVLSYYAPRWGSHRWGEPQVVKGCMSGQMMEKDIKDHCEVSEEDDEDIFTCFCSSKDNCNGGKKLDRLDREEIELVTCECDGEHCKGESTCVGELCSYVVNHKTKEVEKGCVNASVPLVERRSMGSCMIPPITGAMHHSVAKEAEDLLSTESCVCAADYCNEKKPKPKVDENMKCNAFVNMEYMGNKMTSRNITCTGEYCFKASIKSSIGLMKEYNTMGCASFINGAELADELRPTGCAKFESEKLEVEACYRTTDKAALARAKQNQHRKPSLRKNGRKGSKSSGGRGRRPDYEDEEEEDVEVDIVDQKNKDKEGREKDKSKEKEEEEEEEKEKEEKAAAKEERETSTVKFVFVPPTEAEIPDESNATMITVFLLIILCICVAGITWKFQLHRKLMRSNYDTVAGG